MSKRFLLVMAVFVAIFIGLLFINKKDAGAPSGDSGGQVTNHIYSQGSSGVTVLEYGDFECTACFSYYPVFKQLKEKYKDQVTFQYRHFPIISSHPKAMAAHRAAEAAGRQGKFWEMHDLLYEHAYQMGSDGRPIPIDWVASTNPNTFFESYAGQLGLNVEQFKSDSNSSAVSASIQADMEAGEEAGATGTPTFLIDNKRIDTPNSLEAFEKLIEESIKAKSSAS